MLTFPDSPQPCDVTDTVPSADLAHEITPETPADTSAPWATVVHRFTKASDDAYQKLNADFGLTLDRKTFARLRDLFGNILHRDPTVGELFLLCELDRPGAPHRRAVGELYTNSSAIAETWADIMAKHGELYTAAGLLYKKTRTPPPCTPEDALSLTGRYLYRRGLVAPLTDGLPRGDRNAEGRITILSTPAQEADAIAEGYGLLKRLDFGHTTRSLWVRRGPAMKATPAAPGDFLVCLPSPDPDVLTELLAKEREKKHPSVGGIAALSSQCPLEAVLSLCDGADIYPERLPCAFEDMQADSSPLAHLCAAPALTSPAPPDYLLRIPAQKVKEWIGTLREAGVAVVPVGQVKPGDQIRIYLRQGVKDIPVAVLSAGLLRIYPSMTLYRCQVESTPTTAEIPSPVLLDLPETGLTMASTAVTITGEEGYTAAMETISSAISPLIANGRSTRDIRLSVSIHTAGDEKKRDGYLTGLVCGLYRAAAEGGMAMENPVLTHVSSNEGRSPVIHLSVVAYTPSAVI